MQEVRITYVGDGVLDVPCRQLPVCKLLRVQRGPTAQIGLFCLRRPHFLCRQEMGERSDSGEALTAVAIVPLLRSLLPCSPQSRPPPRPPPGRWRVSLLRGSRYLNSTINRNLPEKARLLGAVLFGFIWAAFCRSCCRFRISDAECFRSMGRSECLRAHPLQRAPCRSAAALYRDLRMR